MSYIVKEKEIVNQKTPNGLPWTEEQIRQYQEAHGINYGQAVYEKGVKPNREWSNDRTFGVSDVQQVNPPVAVETKVDMGYEAKLLLERSRVAELEAKIESLMEAMKPTIPSIKEVIATHGVERHTKPLDKRSKEYRESLKKQA